MTMSADELERQNDASRAALSQDVQALKEKVRPRRLMSDAVMSAKGKGRRMAEATSARAQDLAARTTSQAKVLASRTSAQAKSLARRTTAQAKVHPIPFAVAGGALLAGAAWLVAWNWKKRRDRLV